VIRRHVDPDLAELVFRLLFSSIFIVLGGEHVFRDELIQNLIPAWVPMKRALSLGAGVLLLGGGASIALGFRMHWAAVALGCFLVAVTLLVHVPGMFGYPQSLPADWGWLWDLYQRSNFIKNVCLLGVCFHFLHHEPGWYSVDRYLEERAVTGSTSR
jgi:uncharacterized membrane protein YphA (DoxX/SURF4 family)